MNEKIFKTLSSIGASGITVGVLCIVTGLSLGILAIVSGGRALKLKKNIMI